MNLLNLSLIKIIFRGLSCQVILDNSIVKPRAGIELIYKLNNNGCNSAPIIGTIKQERKNKNVRKMA